MEINIGNAEISIDDLAKLTKFGDLYSKDEGSDALFLRVHERTFSRAELIDFAVLVHGLGADEFDVDGDSLRFWWD